MKKYLTDIIDLKYMKNKDGKTCNPRISACSILNLETNELSPVKYTLKTYDNKETFGYYYNEYDNYKDAKNKLNELVLKYHHV